MVDKIRVGVIFGGRSGEHEVSLMSAHSVLSVLDPQKYTVIAIGITHEGAWYTGKNIWEALQNDQLADQVRVGMVEPVTILPDPTHPGLYGLRQVNQAGLIECLAGLDVVFPVMHGSFGEDGTLQGLLEMANVAYVGAGVLGSSVGMDKALFKDVMRANHLPVVPSLIFSRREIETEMEQVINRATALAAYPLFVKPANLGSSVGITKCRSRSDLVEGLLEAARYDRRILVERGVNAREIEVSVLGNENPLASIPGEIRPADEFYSYSAKYLDERSELIIPAPLPSETITLAQDLAARAYKAIDCAGMARVDFLLDKDTGELFISEINTIPGFTKISMYPKLWEASGLHYPQLVDRLVDLALERKAEQNRTERQYRRGG
jgi:D-alanine-D-alanine ligase